MTVMILKNYDMYGDMDGVDYDYDNDDDDTASDHDNANYKDHDNYNYNPQNYKVYCFKYERYPFITTNDDIMSDDVGNYRMRGNYDPRYQRMILIKTYQYMM